jgi:hypothetical protein
MAELHAVGPVPPLLRFIESLEQLFGRFPRPIELCDGKPTQRGAVIRSLGTLEAAGLVTRHGQRHWGNAQITALGYELLGGAPARVFRSATHPTPATPKQGDISRTTSPGRVGWSQRNRAVLAAAVHAHRHHTEFPSPNSIGRQWYGEHMTNWQRAHLVTTFRRLEKRGYIARKRSGQMSWRLCGYLTPHGYATAQQLGLERQVAAPTTSPGRRGGGLSPDGGSRFPKMVFAADTVGIVKFPSPYSKLGQVATKASGEGRQLELPIATFSLEEGRTCDPACGLAKVCYAGKMPYEKRIRYEGHKTDRLVAKAIAEAGPHHWRVNTVGDIPSQSFLEAVLAAITVSCSTAFGYTHWPRESELGAAIAYYSERYWGFFSIRTSYEDGGREPLPSRAAVVVERFTPEVLRLHHAIPCPEQLQNKGYRTFRRRINCGSCGLCWTTQQNIAFERH